MVVGGCAVLLQPVTCGVRDRVHRARGERRSAWSVLPVRVSGTPRSRQHLVQLRVAGRAFSIGLLARSWAEYRDRIIRSAAERAVAEERASHAERARIARELHDVIAHTITVIVMQAGGARLASASDPVIAASTLAQIEELGRASLAELRSLLPLLQRRTTKRPRPPPQPTLADVDELCERMRGLGLPVALQVDGDSSDVPLGLAADGIPGGAGGA